MAGTPTHRLLFDQMVSVPALRRLQATGVDAVHVLEVGLAGAADREVLEYAKEHGRIVVTRNYRDFAPLVQAYARRGIPFPGVLFLRRSLPHGDVGDHVRTVTGWLERNELSNPVVNTYGWA